MPIVIHPLTIAAIRQHLGLRSATPTAVIFTLNQDIQALPHRGADDAVPFVGFG
jgi:hypothetical protein